MRFLNKIYGQRVERHRKVEIIDILDLTEIERIVKLLKYHKLCATTRKFKYLFSKTTTVIVDIRSVMLLY